MLVELIGQKKPPSVVIAADGDGPGKRGAEVLAMALLPVCRAVRVISPPDGIKDARAWKVAGARRQDVLGAIAAAPIRALRMGRRRGQ